MTYRTADDGESTPEADSVNVTDADGDAMKVVLGEDQDHAGGDLQCRDGVFNGRARIVKDPLGPIWQLEPTIIFPDHR